MSFTNVIYKFMARGLIEGKTQEKLDLQTVTLEDFLAFDDVKNYVHDALAFVAPTATLGAAQAAMEKDEDCQDILVTKTGTREGEDCTGSTPPTSTSPDTLRHEGTDIEPQRVLTADPPCPPPGLAPGTDVHRAPHEQPV